MARADRRQAERQARQVQRRPRAAGGGRAYVEDTMFFPRLRAHARWMFVLLAVVFAGSFVFLGVGSGAGGIGDLLQGNWSDFFGSSSGSSAQIKKDQKRIDENPKDYAAYRDLAAAQASDDKLDDAIATLLKLKSVNPKDVDGLTPAREPLHPQGRRRPHRRGRGAGQGADASSSQSTFAPAHDDGIGKAYQSFIAPAINSVLEGKVERQVPGGLLEDDLGIQPGRRRVQGRREGEPERPEHRSSRSRRRPSTPRHDDGDRRVQAVPEARAGRPDSPPP